MNTLRLPLLLLLPLVLVAFSDETKKTRPAEKTADAVWENLLEGNSLDKWRSTRKTKEGWHPIGSRWQVKDGVLSLDRTREGRGGHLETKKNYFDFELKFDFNIKHNCNSGIKYRCKNAIGFEYQILDDENHRDNTVTHRTAELYELAAEETPRTLNAAGKWNSGRILAQGNTITHWLNGKKVLSIEFGSADWKTRFEDSKYFRQKKLDFGTHLGPIHLQDHSDTDIELKNVLIRAL